MGGNIPETEMFPRVVTARVYNSRNYLTGKTSPRITEFFELGLFLDDGGTWFINGTPYKIKRGSIRFVRPQSSVCSVPHFISMTVILGFGDDGLSYDKNLIDAIPEFFYGGEELIPLFTDIIYNFGLEEAGSKLKMNSLVCRLLHELYLIAQKSSKLSETVGICTNYIKEHYSENVTLETLGRVTGYVPLHVLRLFKSQTGKTPHEFLTSTRLAHARILLDSTTLSVSEISGMCGFNSVSHFQTLFQKRFNISPGKYRKKTNYINYGG